MEWHLNQPPFPPLVADNDDRYFWQADDVPFTGLWPEPAHLSVQTEQEEGEQPAPPSAGQAAAFAELAAVGPAAVAATVNALRSRGRRYAAADLADQLRLLAVHIAGVERDGVAYFALEMVRGDDEHPFGAVLHRGRLVGLAAADDAVTFDLAVADVEPGAAAEGGGTTAFPGA